MKTKKQLMFAGLIISGFLLDGCSLFGPSPSSGKQMTVESAPAGGGVSPAPAAEQKQTAAKPVKTFWASKPSAPAAPPKAKTAKAVQTAVAATPADGTPPVPEPAESSELTAVAEEITAVETLTPPEQAAAVPAKNSGGSDLFSVFLIFGLFFAGLVAEPLYRKVTGAS